MVFLTGGFRAAAQAPLCPMVPLFHKWQMEKAAGQVEKLAAAGESRLQFCICQQSELTESFVPLNFGMLRETRGGGGGNTFYPSDAPLRAELRGYCEKAFAACRAKAIRVAVLLHLNAHGKIQEWRNNFDFDPLQPAGGATYEEALVLPVVEALESALPPDALVEISLQGEMGTTVFKHPESWRKLVERLRQRGRLKKLQVGLSFNHEGVAGKAEPAQLNRAALGDLWKACDFIGISAYQKVSSPPAPEDFDFNLGRFAGEFAGLGCALPDGKPLHVVEVGLGGGGLSPKDWKFHVPALTPADAAGSPFFGTGEISENPWTSEPLKALRRSYHEALLAWLARPKTRHPVPVAYLWSFGSWDVHGLEQPVFGDETIVQRIRGHNARLPRREP